MQFKLEIMLCSGSGAFIPRTALGKKLASLRGRAIASGMRLLIKDEILEEVKRPRGELDVDEKDVH
jgi:hypothetical protein